MSSQHTEILVTPRCAEKAAEVAMNLPEIASHLRLAQAGAVESVLDHSSNHNQQKHHIAVVHNSGESFLDEAASIVNDVPDLSQHIRLMQAGSVESVIPHDPTHGLGGKYHYESNLKCDDDVAEAASIVIDLPDINAHIRQIHAGAVESVLEHSDDHIQRSHHINIIRSSSEKFVDEAARIAQDVPDLAHHTKLMQAGSVESVVRHQR